MTTKILEFDPIHVDAMEMRGVEAHYYLDLPDSKERVAAVADNSLFAITVVHDGVVLFCAGFSIVWPGVGDGWIIPSVHVPKYPRVLCRIIKDYLTSFIDTFNLHRVQTTSYHDPLHERWMNWLGFENEGVMRNFTHDKQDHCMYARII